MAGFLKISIPIKVSSELKLIPRKLQVSKLQQCFVQKKLWNSVLSELRIKSFLLINNFSFICQFSHFPSSKIIAFVFLRNFRISFFFAKNFTFLQNRFLRNELPFLLEILIPIYHLKSIIAGIVPWKTEQLRLMANIIYG